MRSNYLVFGSPIIEDEEINSVISTLKSKWIGTGPKVNQFEKMFSEYIGTKHAVAVSSCTAGLHLSVIALGIKPGDEIIVPAMTFAATANAVIHANAIPVLTDVDKWNMTIDFDDIERKITEKTKAIIPVHFAGRAVDIKKLNSLAEIYNLKIIHDTAHAVETEYEGKKIGCYNDLSSYSFYVTKNITSIEGGMVTTNNEELANKIKINALHGMSQDAWKRFSDNGYKHYQVIFPGFKYNMTDVQAAIGIEQLKKIDRFAKRRKEVWDHYRNELKDMPLFLPPNEQPGTKHALHLFTIMLDIDNVKLTRDQLMKNLHEMNIGTGVHYISLHLHEYYKNTFNFKENDFPNSKFISDRTLSIPFSANLTDDDVEDVIYALKSCLS
ncbi:MAG: DegT/DnrJ/EryC1/StrS aminotransferase family protein [Ignavibacteriaceae bacterium]|nr:DegT/DnrJ/EryC1/StrS aminotransferase family protein [Ignavibacteriaceae bacterium]